MQVSDEGLFALAVHEAIVPGPYLDSVNVWTWGVGHTASAGSPDPAKMARGMPADLDAALAEVLRVFRRDVQAYAAEVSRVVKVPLAQHEFDALVSFHYNTGAIARATLTRHLNAGDRAAAGKAFMAWIRPASLKDRREYERDLFLHGRYPAGPVTVWGVDGAGRVIWKPVQRIGKAEFLALMGAGAGAGGAVPALPGWLAAILKMLGVRR